MIIERWVPSLVFHHQPKQTTSLDVSTKARSLDAGGPESSLPPDGGVEVLHLGDLRRRNHLDNHLRDMATSFTEKFASEWLKSTAPTGCASQRRSPLRPCRESENLLVRKLHQFN